MNFKGFIYKLLNFTRLAFSERGYPSSKRLFGGFIIICAMAYTGWSIWKDGMTENNKNVLETEIVIAGALLGVSSVTSIWKGNANTGTIGNNQNIEAEDTDGTEDSYSSEIENKQ